MGTNSFGTRDRLTVDDTAYQIERLERVDGAGRFPYSLKVLLENLLRNVTLPDATGVSRRYARLSDVWSHRDRLAGRILLPDLAEELGITYHDAYHALRRLGLAAEQHPISRQCHLTPDAADALRAEHQRIQYLHRRSMKLAAASRQLKVALSTAALLSRTGQLDVDPETDSSGARFVTRTPIEAYWLDHRRAILRGGPGGVAVGEVARFTGLADRDVVALVEAGVLDQLPGRGWSCHITVASLCGWLRSGRRLPAAGLGR